MHVTAKVSSLSYLSISISVSFLLLNSFLQTLMHFVEDGYALDEEISLVWH
jgi:hypothetical protein